MKELQAKAQKIRLMIFDVDGVLTDGSLILSGSGQELKSFHSRDGLGMKMLQASGVSIAIITGRQSDVVALRMKSLGIEHVFQGQRNKLPAFETLRDQLGLDNEQVAYVGDDIVDLPIMSRIGLAIAVHDAHHLVKQRAHWQTTAVGGRGAAREACEFIMAAQGTLDTAQEPYLK